MAALAETYETVPKPKLVEEYGRSLAAMRQAGELLVHQQVSVECLIEETEMYPDFKTAVKEMLKNDKEFSSKLELSNRREHNILSGQVVNAKGDPMIDVLDNGRIASSLLAEQDSGYDYQVARDEADIRLAEKVDELSEGKTIWGVSKDPEKALQNRPDIYEKRFGYKKGLMYLQTYSKNGGKVHTGSHAIDCQYPDVLRQILAEYDMVIPSDESDDMWLDHAVNADMSPGEAETLARSIRREYYKRIGESVNRVSVDEFVEEHEEILVGFFRAYYPDMAKVATTGINQSALQKLAGAMLAKNPEKLKPEVVRELIRIRNASKIDDEAVKVLDSIVRYATVEELRKHISFRLTPQMSKTESIPMPSTSRYVGQAIHYLLAQNVEDGVSAGRSYPGCPGNIDLARETTENKPADMDGLSTRNLQEAFGGLTAEDDDCDFISEECPECHEKKVKTVVKVVRIGSKKKKLIEGDCGCIKIV